MFLVGPDGQRYVATDGPSYQLLPAAQTLTVNLALLGFIALITVTALMLPLARLRRREPPPTGGGGLDG